MPVPAQAPAQALALVLAPVLASRPWKVKRTQTTRDWLCDELCLLEMYPKKNHQIRISRWVGPLEVGQFLALVAKCFIQLFYPAVSTWDHPYVDVNDHSWHVA